MPPATGADLAHGVGGPADLPLPAGYAFAGAVAALLVSFAVLGLAWRRPRFGGESSGSPLPRAVVRLVESRVVRGILVAAVLLLTGWTALAALAGPDTLANPTFGVVYVLLWVGLVPAALLLGPVYRLCNPLRWLHRAVSAAAGTDHRSGLKTYPARLGYWPAAFFLLCFVWLELVDPSVSTSLPAIRLWFGAAAALLMVGAAVYGDRWFSYADPFEVYASLVARLSPWGRRSDGALVRRNPLENLDSTPSAAGLVGVVAVLLGSTAFDSFRGSSRWLRFSQQHADAAMLLNTAALVGFCLAVLGTFTLAAAATGGGAEVRRRDLPAHFAHSVVPIVVGYVVAHYLSFFVASGIGTLQQLGDPLGRGWRLTGWLDGVNKYAIYDHPTALAVTKVVAVVAGHVLGVIAAHDRAVRLLPRGRVVVGQLPMIALMAAYTLTGLGLLFSS